MDNIVPLQLRVPPGTGKVEEENAGTDPTAQAEVKNVLNAFAVATAKGLPRSLIVVMADHDGKPMVMTGGAFHITETVGILEDIKFNLLIALSDARE